MSYSYTPRRAGKRRWLQEAPDYVLDVFDNKDKSADRYTVMFTGKLLIKTRFDIYVPFLGMSDNPDSPQGFSQWGEMDSLQAVEFRKANGRDRIRWKDLPGNVRQHIANRIIFREGEV